jgi:hypothetical protein
MRVRIQFDYDGDPENLSLALMRLEDAIPDEADNFEWDTDE